MGIITSLARMNTIIPVVTMLSSAQNVFKNNMAGEAQMVQQKCIVNQEYGKYTQHSISVESVLPEYISSRKDDRKFDANK